jgi:predicted MarR family transcription regulator
MRTKFDWVPFANLTEKADSTELHMGIDQRESCIRHDISVPINPTRCSQGRSAVRCSVSNAHLVESLELSSINVATIAVTLFDKAKALTRVQVNCYATRAALGESSPKILRIAGISGHH